MVSFKNIFFGLLTTVYAAPPPASPEDQLQTFATRDAPGYEMSGTSPAALGIDKVNQTSGYLQTPTGDKLFYYFFESRSNPSKDPVLIWLNGGPGCSSLQAVLFENGPSSLKQGQLTNNTESWNNHANVLYIDNPAQVGFSQGKKITTTPEAAEDFKNALIVFFSKYPQFKDNGLYVSGESYAGRYIPVFAKAVNDDPRSIVKVKSVLIGNGLVDPIAEYESYYPMLCGQGGYPSPLTEGQCNTIQENTPKCLSHLKSCMSEGGMGCTLAALSCSTISKQFSHLNPYDIRSRGCEDSGTHLCYPEMDDIQKYFNQPNVQSALGVPAGTKYQICNNKMNADFYKSHDPYSPTFKIVGDLLDSGVSVLAFNGDADIILNWIGTSMWTRNLNWHGKNEFAEAAESPVSWKPKNNEQSGTVTNAGNFTFLRVHGAGHMVPHDQPEVASYMIDSWLNGDLKFNKKF